MGFLSGLAEGFATGQQMGERQRQEEGLRKLIDLLGTQETTAQNIKNNNAAYDFQADNPAIKASGYKFDNTLTSDNKFTPDNTFVGDAAPKSNFGLGDLLTSKPSYRDNISMMPTSRQAAPTYDSGSMYGLLAKAVQSGVPASMAMQVIPNYYSSKQAEVDKDTKKKLLASVIGKMPVDKQQIANLSVAGLPDKVIELAYPKPEKPTYHYSEDKDGNVWQINSVTGQKLNFGPVGKGTADKWVTESDDAGNTTAVNLSTGERRDLGRIGKTKTQAAATQSERYIDTPFGKMTVTSFLALHKDALGGESYEKNDFGTTTHIKPPKQDVLKWSQPIYDALTGQNTSGGGAPSYNYDQIMSDITANLMSKDKPPDLNRQKAEAIIRQKYGNLGPDVVNKILADVDWKAFRL